MAHKNLLLEVESSVRSCIRQTIESTPGYAIVWQGCSARGVSKLLGRIEKTNSLLATLPFILPPALPKIMLADRGPHYGWCNAPVERVQSQDNSPKSSVSRLTTVLSLCGILLHVIPAVMADASGLRTSEIYKYH